MKISDCMTRNVRLVSPQQTIQEAARMMAEMDAGVLPVGDNDRLVGMITDRDIAIRAVCAGKGPDTKVEDAMTREVKYCFEDEDVDHVARNMGDLQVRRLPVMNRDKRLVGIVTLGDIATNRRADTELIGEALGSISRTGGLHSQTGAGH
jgi:CBS domain-containing protein